MACIVLKKLLGYELCVLEKEGTLFYSDPIVIIRKEGFTETYYAAFGIFSKSRYFFADFYVPDSLYYMRRAK